MYANHLILKESDCWILGIAKKANNWNAFIGNVSIWMTLPHIPPGHKQTLYIQTNIYVHKQARKIFCRIINGNIAIQTKKKKPWIMWRIISISNIVFIFCMEISMENFSFVVYQLFHILQDKIGFDAFGCVFVDLCM